MPVQSSEIAQRSLTIGADLHEAGFGVRIDDRLVILGIGEFKTFVQLAFALICRAGGFARLSDFDLMPGDEDAMYKRISRLKKQLDINSPGLGSSLIACRRGLVAYKLRIDPLQCEFRSSLLDLCPPLETSTVLSLIDATTQMNDRSRSV